MCASVERQSLGEEHGLQVGDQILLVNGHSFEDMLHSEAAAILKNSNLLIMTIRVSGYKYTGTCTNYVKKRFWDNFL